MDVILHRLGNSTFDVLHAMEVEGEVEGVDLQKWSEVLAKVDDLLSSLVDKVVTATTNPLDPSASPAAPSIDHKAVVCNVLRFLCRLLRGAREKRAFPSFKHLGKLLHAVDLEIVELAAEALFHACAPGLSSRSLSDEPEKESVDVPLAIAQDVLVVFEGLGMLSPQYGVLDFLRGHEPLGVSPGVARLALDYPVRGSPGCPAAEGKTVTIELPLDAAGRVLQRGRTAVDDAAIMQSLSACIVASGSGGSSSSSSSGGGAVGGGPDTIRASSQMILEAQRGVEEEDAQALQHSRRALSLLSVLRACGGLQGSAADRSRIALLRLRCAFILSHSKVEADRLAPYMCSWGVFFRDCLALADCSSEALAELQLEEPMALSTAALENVSALLECCVRRRGGSLSHYERAGVLRELGISPDGPTETSASHEPVWTSVVLSACSLSSFLFEGRTAATSQLRVSTASPVEALALQRAVDWSSHAQLGLELFTGCLSVRENNPANHYSSFDAGVVNAVIGLLHSSLPAVSAILADAEQARLASPTPQVPAPLSCWDSVTVLTVAKALSALVRCYDVSQYQLAVRDNDGLAPVVAIIEAFVNTRQGGAAPFAGDLVLDVPRKSVLETCFDIVAVSLDVQRRAAHSANNAPVAHIVHQPCFQKICRLVFALPFRGHELLWCHLLKVIRGAINAEPSFLGHFLRSEYIVGLTGALDVAATEASNPRSLLHSPAFLDKALVALAKLSVSMCITPEGQAWLVENRMPKFLVEVFVQPSVLLPASEGLCTDTSHKVAKSLVVLMRDCPTSVEAMQSALLRGLQGSCDDCLSAWTSFSPSVDSVPFASPRMQALQRLSNICGLVESICSSDQKRNSASADMIRALITEDVVQQLVAAFSCTLPPPRQLLAQLGVRHNTSIPYCGYHPTASKLTSLFKAASMLVPQVILPVLFRSIDETLSAVSAAKSALRAFTAQYAADGTSLSSSFAGSTHSSAASDASHEDEEAMADRTARRQQRGRSRGGSLGGEGANVLILGVLDYLPHRCVFDSAEDDRSRELEQFTWRFLTPILILEWLGQIMSFCLRPIQRSPATSHAYLTNGKDVIRRLFAFHRSSLLEVCRFAATKWVPRPAHDQAPKRALLHCFADCDSSEDAAPINRIPRLYILRVVSPAGTPIREDCEIENSRVVQSAAFGAVFTAFERCHTVAGVARYRTSLGWLSEYRRDHHREPIVEIVDILNGDAADAHLAAEYQQARRGKTVQQLRAVEALTMRESAAYALTRVHSALKLAGVYLSRATLSEGGPEGRMGRASGRPLALSPSAPVLVNSLSKSIKGFFVQPMECLEEASIPPSLPLSIVTSGFGTSSASSSTKSTPVPSLKDWAGIVDDSTPVKDREGAKDRGSARRGSSKKDKNERKSLSRTNSRDFTLVDASPDESKESVLINGAAMSLYLGAVVKYFVLPVLDDRFGNLNTYLVRTMSSFGCMEALMDAFAFIVATLTNALGETVVETKVTLAGGGSSSSSGGSGGGGSGSLSSAGCCALHSLPSMLSLLRRLVHRDALTRAVGGADMAKRGPNPITAAISNLEDELGRFQLHELLFNVLHAIGSRALPFFRARSLTLLPAGVQAEWYQFVGDMLQSMRTPLPAPSSTADSGGGPSLMYNPFRPPSASGDRERDRDRGLGDYVSPVRRAEGPEIGSIFAQMAQLEQLIETRSPQLTPARQPQETAAMLVSAINNLSAGSSEAAAPVSLSMEDAALQQAMLDEDLLAEAGGDLNLLAALHFSRQVSDAPPPVPPTAVEGQAPSPGAAVSSAESAAASEGADPPSAEAAPAPAPAPAPATAAAEDMAFDDQPDAPMQRLSTAQGPSSRQHCGGARRRASSGPMQSSRERLVLLRDEAMLEDLASPLGPSASGMPPLPPPPRSPVDAVLGVSSSSISRGSTLERVNSTGSSGSSSSGGSRSDKKPPSGKPSSSASAKSGSSLSDDLANKSAALEALAASFDVVVVDSVIDSCMLRSDRPRSAGARSPVPPEAGAANAPFFAGDGDPAIADEAADALAPPRSIAPQMCKFLIQWSEENAESSGEKPWSADLVRRLASKIDVNAGAKESPVSEQGLYGCMHLLLCCLRSAVVRSKLARVLDRRLAHNLLRSVLGRIDAEAEAGSLAGAETPAWVSPALLVLFQLLCSENRPADGPSKSSESKTDSKADSKADSKSSSEKMPPLAPNLSPEQQLVRNLSTSLLGDFLVDAELWPRVYATAERVLEAFSRTEGLDSAPPTSAQKVNAEVCQSLLLLLSVLLARQGICDSFVDSGRLALVLTLPASLAVDDSAPGAAASATSSILAIIVQRCLETPIELRVNMSLAFRAFWKGATRQSTLKAKRGVPLGEFLEFAEAAGFMRRSPVDFGAAMYNTMAVITDAPEGKEGKEGKDDKREGKSEAKAPQPQALACLLNKRVHEERYRDDKLALLQQGVAAGAPDRDLDDRAVRTVRALLGHVQAVIARAPAPAADAKPLSYAETKALVEAIARLGPQDQVGLFAIIRELNPGLGAGADGEIELDMEQMDTLTLREMQAYVEAKTPGGTGAPASPAASRADKDAYLYSISQAMHALSDSLLSLRRLPRLVSKGAFTVTVPGHEAPISLAEFLVTTIFQDDDGAPPKKSAIPASTRLLVVLCASKGLCRKSVLNALVRALEVRLGAGLPEDAAERSKHIRHVARVARLVAIVVSAAKDAQRAPGSRPDQQTVISVEAIQFLIAADIQTLLTRILASIPLDDALAVDALDAICEPLEIITRPKLVTHLRALDAAQRAEALAAEQGDRRAAEGTAGAASDSTANAAFAGAEADGDPDASLNNGLGSASAQGGAEGAGEQLLPNEPQDLQGEHGPEERQPIVSAIMAEYQRMVAEAEGGEAGQEDEEDDEEEEEEEEDEDDDGEDEDEEEDGEEDDEDAEDEDLEDEDEDEDDDEDGRGIQEAVHVPQSDANGPFFGNNPFNMDPSRGMQEMVDELMRSVLAENSGMSMNDAMAGFHEAAQAGLFVTPPDQIRREPFNSLLSRISPSDMDHDASAEALIVNLLRQGGPMDEGGMSAAFSTLRGGPGGRRAETISHLLPQGVVSALQVQSRQHLPHPLLSAGDFAVERSLLCDVLTESMQPPERQAFLDPRERPEGRGHLASYARRFGVPVMTPGAGPFVGPGFAAMPPLASSSDVLAAPQGFRFGASSPSGTAERFAFHRSFLDASHAHPADASLGVGPGVHIPGEGRPEAGSRPLRRASFLSTLVGAAATHSLYNSLPAYDADTMESLPHAPLAPSSAATPMGAPGEADRASVPAGQNFVRGIDLGRPRRVAESAAEAIAEAAGGAGAREPAVSAAVPAPSVAFVPPPAGSAAEVLTLLRREAAAAPLPGPPPITSVVDAGAAAAALDGPPSLDMDSSDDDEGGFVLAPSASPVPGGPGLLGSPVLAREEEESSGSVALGREAEAEEAAEAEAALRAFESGGPPPLLPPSGSPSSASAARAGGASAAPAPAPAPTAAAAAAAAPPAAACPAGYDPDVFFSLPDFMQAEILEQHGQTNQPDNVRELAEAAGFDYETFLCLPESIRQELLEQARRDQQAVSAASAGAADHTIAQEMDNASFLASLADPALRAEVLLTADPAFLATLPPELNAEATMHRERIAANWQHREMQRAGGGGGPGSGRRSAPGLGAAWQPREEEGDEETDDDDDGMGRGGIPGLRRRHASRPAADGTMLVPADDQTSTLVPRELLLVLSKIIINANLRVNSLLLQRLLLNISKFPPYRDIGLRLCMGMMTNRQAVVDECARLLLENDIEGAAQTHAGAMAVAVGAAVAGGGTAGAGEAAVQESASLLVASDGPRAPAPSVALGPACPGALRLNLRAVASAHTARTAGAAAHRQAPSIKGSAPPALDAASDAEGPNEAFPPAIVRRLAITVAQLVAQNESISFDLLRPRVLTAGEPTPLSDFAVAEPPAAQAEAEGKRGQGAKDASGRSRPKKLAAKETAAAAEAEAAALSAAPRKDEKEPSAKAAPAAPASPVGPSTNSLLEDFIAPLALEHVLADPPALVALTHLIAHITGPLERLLPEDGDGLAAAAPAPAARDLLYIPLRVPAVNLHASSLRALCEVLLADQCGKEVFDNIVVAVSRLAKMRRNRGVILDALTEVTRDLAGQSHGKLAVLGASLRSLAALLQAQAAPGGAAAGDAGSTPRSSSGVNQLPLGQVCGRSHDRFLRAVQTLQTVSLKTSSALIDVMPLEAVAPLWNALDEVMGQLRRYVVEEAEEASGNVQTQSALVSFLTRLLAAIEAFFLVFTSETLAEGDAAIAAATAAAAAAAAGGGVKAAAAAAADPASASASASASAAAPASAPAPAAVERQPSAPAAPGEKHHKAAAYQRMNLPLAPDGSDDALSRATALQRASSLPRQMSYSYSAPGSSANAGSGQSARFHRAQLLLAFVQAHRGVLNLLIASRPALLQGSLSALIRVPLLRSALVFENKRKYFFAQLKALRVDRARRLGGLHLQLRRDQVFEDSFNQLRSRTAEEMRGRMQISFRGEEGIDAGGLTREWYLVLSREIFNPNYALFTTADGSTFQPWAQSMVNSNHLDYFRFVGRVIGKAVCDQQLMDAHFTRSFYKHVIGTQVDYSDIEATEPDYFKSLKQILDFSLEDLGLDLTFSAETSTFGRVEVVDLIPGGRGVAVTDDNKHEYVTLVAKHRMTTAIRAQIDSFLDGFYDLVPADLITIFSPTELELLICGLPEVDVEDLCAHTEYHNFQPADPAIQFFWETLRGFSREERALFLQFVTGTSKVPLDGFASLQGMRGPQRFSIHRAFNAALLPTAHTCFNQLDLPAYKSAEEMREKLLVALQHSSEGFGFA